MQMSIKSVHRCSNFVMFCRTTQYSTRNSSLDGIQVFTHENGALVRYVHAKVRG